jgi:hypothetical protein
MSKVQRKVTKSVNFNYSIGLLVEVQRNMCFAPQMSHQHQENGTYWCVRSMVLVMYALCGISHLLVVIGQ